MIRTPAAGHVDGPAEEDVLHELAEHGLRRYTAQVAAVVGVGSEAAWCEWADVASAYIALEDRLPDYPDRDTALTWDAERGWTVIVETGCGEDLLITASLDGDVLPPPDTVAAWVRAAVTDRHSGARGCCGTPAHAHAAVRAEVANRLADWAGNGPTLDDRTDSCP
ncbi:hypothetical protein F0L68_36075 [Solihabitans fulvus]|uniref:DUF6292 domain-containing protein n=1 Tax=Solihabitans fulvus TaxID=1892852 RepID=A0A5B2WPV7_9PSEU|nr:DUF6292 family protein [Solihabitans fulvus]KAA2252459.1 hypothetical protein F0L68_36075 [Solihabitans fulvus]